MLKWPSTTWLHLQVDDIMNHHLKQKQSYNPEKGANHKQMPLTMNIWNPMEKVNMIVAHNYSRTCKMDETLLSLYKILKDYSR